MLDQDKLIAELTSRCKRAFDLAKAYKEDGSHDTASRLDVEGRIYTEIINDIVKGKFKLKEKKIKE